jgi:hypothetical protein
MNTDFEGNINTISLGILSDSLTFSIRGFVHALCEDADRYQKLDKFYMPIIQLSEDLFYKQLLSQVYQKLIGDVKVNTAFELTRLIALNRSQHFFDEHLLKSILIDYSDALVSGSENDFMKAIFINAIFDEQQINLFNSRIII